MKNGTLYINDKPVGERLLGTHTATDFREPQPVAWIEETNPEGRKYVIQDHGKGFPVDDTAVYVVPPHCYFMIGDNRDNSLDSRFDPGLAPNDPRLGGCGWDACPATGGAGGLPGRRLRSRRELWSARPCSSCCRGTAAWTIPITRRPISSKPWTWFTHARPSRFFKALK